MSKPRVMCFLDNPLGRDTEVVLPIIYVLEKYLHAEVKTKFIWDLFYMKLWKPDVILLPNVVGHHMYVEAATFATANNIKVLALESEGNFRTDGKFNYWGYNLGETVYQEWLTCWSQRTFDYLKDTLKPEDQQKLILTGATGFDRISFEKFQNKQDFLQGRGLLKFSKVIGYAGWAFGKLYSSHLENSFLVLTKAMGREKALKWVERQREFVRDVLKELIINNPDTLFILKKHPKENFESDPIEGKNEMNELTSFENVLYVKTEVSTVDLISVSDLWLGFETTTALEAWLIGKTTCLINSEVNFPRSDLYKGSIIASGYVEAQNFIDTFYATGSIEEFDSAERTKSRIEAIKDSIGFSDGMNHLRACNFFRRSLPANYQSKKVPINLRHLRLFLLMHLGRFLYVKKLFMRLPKFKKTIYVFENRKMKGFKDRKARCFKALDKFYEEHHFNNYLENNKWDNFANRLFK